MNYRTTKLIAETNFTSAKTTTIDINVKDMISRILIAWRVTKANNGMHSYAHSDISKIELVDGSEVLYSLSGGESQAVCIYDRKVGTMNHGQAIGGSSMYSTYAIDFGRFLYDPELAFNPLRFNNPQLKITHSHLISDTGASSGNLEVWAKMFDERQISPMGFLSTRQIKDFTVATAGVFDYIDMPTDKVLRKLFIQGYAAGFEPWYQVIEARLNEDGDKRIPFDWDLEDYHRTQKGVLTPVREQLIGIAASGGQDFYVTPTGYWTVLSALTHNNVVDLNIAAASMRGGKVTLVSASNSQFGGLVWGFLPNHVYEFAFGDPQDPSDWYDVTKLGSLELRLKTGTATSGNIRTSVQQLRRY